MKLNREQIIKALECCNSEHSCSECPYCGDCYDGKVCESALALIRELIEEIEGLEVEKEHLDIVVEGKLNRTQSLERLVMKLTDKAANAKADTVRKMQERLKKAFNFGHTILEKSICDIIDQIAKEMLEEDT